jgi:hypothetical protein
VKNREEIPKIRLLKGGLLQVKKNELATASLKKLL